MKRSTKILLALLLLISTAISTGILQPSPTFADQFDPEKEVFSERGYLLISPAKLHYGVIESGNVYSQTFKAYNIGEEALTFELTAEAFSVVNYTYDPIYSEATNRTRIADWVSFPDGTVYTLAPRGQDGDRAEINIRVRVPDNIIGGGQYAAIMANIQPPDTNSGPVQAVARIAIPLYSTINGDLIYKGKFISQAIPSFSFRPIIKTTSTLENHGNADFQASYHLLVEPFLGGEPAFKISQDKIILPETTRIFEQNWEGAPALGIFKVTQSIAYIDESGTEITDTFRRVVVICPLWLILIVLIIIALLVSSFIIRKKRRKFDA